MTTPPDGPNLERFWSQYYTGDRGRACRLAAELRAWAEEGDGPALDLADALIPAAVIARDREQYEEAMALMQRIETLYDRQEKPIPERRAQHLHRMSYLHGLMDDREAARAALALARDVLHERDSDLAGQHRYYWGVHWMLGDEIGKALDCLREAMGILEHARFFAFAQFNFTHCLILTENFTESELEALIGEIAYNRLEPRTRKRTKAAAILRLPPKPTIFDAGYRWCLGVLLARLIQIRVDATAWDRTATRQTMRWMLTTAADTYLALGQESDAATALLDLADCMIISTERRRWAQDILPILSRAQELSKDKTSHCRAISQLVIIGAQKKFECFHTTYQQLRGDLAS